MSWTVKKPNETVLPEASISRSFIERIYKPQAIFFRHVEKKLDVL